jgi:hypothetical protein
MEGNTALRKGGGGWTRKNQRPDLLAAAESGKAIIITRQGKRLRGAPAKERFSARHAAAVLAASLRVPVAVCGERTALELSRALRDEGERKI